MSTTDAPDVERNIFAQIKKIRKTFSGIKTDTTVGIVMIVVASFFLFVSYLILFAQERKH